MAKPNKDQRKKLALCGKLDNFTQLKAFHTRCINMVIKGEIPAAAANAINGHGRSIRELLELVTIDERLERIEAGLASAKKKRKRGN